MEDCITTKPNLEVISYQGTQYTLVFERVHTLRKSRTCVRARIFRADHITVGPSNCDTTSSVANRDSRKALRSKGIREGVIMYMGPHTQYDTHVSRDDDTTGVTDVVLALDAEWTTQGYERKILSYQFAIRVANAYYVYVLSEMPDRLFFTTAVSFLFLDMDAAGIYRLPRGKICITLAAHYGIVDITAFKDGEQLLRRLDTVRRTTVSVSKPHVITVWDENRHKIAQAKITVRDTMLLAPSGSSLQKLGDALGLQKLDLPAGYDKGAMDRLYNERQDTFIAYAAQDAVITLAWIEAMVGNMDEIPATLGSLAAKRLRQAICNARGWTVRDFDYNFRGLETRYEYTGDTRRKKILQPRERSALMITAASSAYFGGRNEAFLHGIHDGPWFDYDLSGAYPTAMSLLPDPDYDATPAAITGRLFKGMVNPLSYLFGHIRFRFPDNTYYPCLPVKDEFGRGLVFPLAGETWACAPEIFLALELGCEIELTQPGFLVPTKNTYSLRDGVKSLVEAREFAKKQHGKGSPQELAAKEIANSAYGKLAQGLSGKRAYSTRADASSEIPPSIVTSAPHAAMTTSLVRAVVSAAMHQLSQRGFRVASVTTDGFLSDAPKDVIDSLDLYGFKAVFEQARKYLVGADEIWELKHAAKSLVMLKTRGGFGVGAVDAKIPLPAAGAGYKVSGKVASRVEQIGKPEALAELFLSRQDGGVFFEFTSLPSPRDYIRKGADAVGKRQQKAISWEWDYKRKPDESTVHTGAICIDNVRYEHVSYATLPWRTLDEFVCAREATERSRVAVKTVGDYADTAIRIKRYEAMRAKSLRARGGGMRSAAISVLRAIRAGVLYGAWLEQASGRDVCARVSKVFGVALGDDDWKNAGRKTRQLHDLTGLDAFLQALELEYKRGDARDVIVLG